jgi:hypothetical protein
MEWLKTGALGVLGATLNGSMIYLALWYIHGPPLKPW